MCPSRRIAPASKQTHQRTLLDISFPLPRTPLRPPSLTTHPPPSPPFHFDGLMVCAELWALQYFHDVSQTHLGLNILFTSSQHSEKPQQYWAEAEVQNSLQFVRVTAKVEVFSVTPPPCLQKADSVTAAVSCFLLPLLSQIYTCFCVMLCEQISRQPHPEAAVVLVR